MAPDKKQNNRQTDQTAADPKGQRVSNPIEQRSPNNQAAGSSDPEDYPESGPLPVGNAPVHPTDGKETTIPRGVQPDEKKRRGNPGDVPNT